MPCVAHVRGVAGVVGVVATTVITVATAYALERHDQKTGSSQEQRECVQIHFTIEAFEGQRGLQDCFADRTTAMPEVRC